MAHRGQIRIRKDESAWQIPNVVITRNGPDETTNEVQGDCNDRPDVCEGERNELPRSVRSRKRKGTVMEPEPQELRRSKRNRKTNQSDDYCYD